MNPITRTHRLAVARAWEGNSVAGGTVKGWSLDGAVLCADSARLERLAQLVADAEGGNEWVICSDNPAVPLMGDVCWVQFDDRTVGSKPHAWAGGPQPWRVNGNIQHAPILAYQLLKAPKPPERPVAVLDGEAPGPDEFACPYCGESCSALIPVSYDAMVDGPGYVVEEERCAKCVGGQP